MSFPLVRRIRCFAGDAFVCVFWFLWYWKGEFGWVSKGFEWGNKRKSNQNWRKLIWKTESFAWKNVPNWHYLDCFRATGNEHIIQKLRYSHREMQNIQHSLKMCENSKCCLSRYEHCSSWNDAKCRVKLKRLGLEVGFRERRPRCKASHCVRA